MTATPTGTAGSSAGNVGVPLAEYLPRSRKVTRMPDLASDPTDDWLTTADVMALTGRARTQVQDWFRSGEIPAVRQGKRWLVERSVLDEWLRTCAWAAAVEEADRRDCKGEHSESAYARGSRDEGCRRAHAEHCAEYKRKRAARVGSASFTHGESGYTNWSCRCGVCCAAWAEKMRRENARRREATSAYAVKDGQPWTEEDEQVLAENQYMRAEDLALMLGRSYVAVSRRRFEMRKAGVL